MTKDQRNTAGKQLMSAQMRLKDCEPHMLNALTARRDRLLLDAKKNGVPSGNLKNKELR